MAITTQMRTDVANLYISLFGRAPERDGLGFWVQQLDSGKTLAQVAQSMYNVDAARAYYPTFLTNEEIVGKFYTNVLGRTADAEGLAFWTAKLTAGATQGAVITEMIAAVKGYAGTDAAALASQSLFNNKVTVGLYYAVDLGGNDVTAATTILQNVTSVASSVDAAKTGAATSAGGSFTFTSSIDSLAGTSGNDTFIGDANVTSAADSVVGGAGTDTLKLFGNTSKPAFSGVETIYLEGNTAGFDVSAATDVTTLQLVDPTTGQTYTIANGQAVSIATVAAGEVVDIAGSTVTALNLTLNGFAASGADATLDLNSTKQTSLAITTATAASQVTLLNTGALLDTVTIAGDKNLEFGSALTTITTINASAATGNVNVDAVGASKLAFTGGSGNDRIDLAATLAANDVIVGGSGTDTVAIGDADTLTALLAPGVSGFEVLEVTTADATAYDVDAIIANNALTGVLSSETGGAGHTISNINSGAVNNISFTGDTPTAVTLGAKGFLSGGTTDAATVILNNSVADNADGVDIATSLTFTLVDKLTVNATSDDTTAARAIVNSVAALTATDLDTLNVTGNAAVSITTAATTAALQEVDASASTGAVTFNSNAGALATMIYRGNSKVDTVTVNNAASNAVTLFTGGGSDVLELGVTGGAHTLHFTATDFTTGDVLAGNALTINLLSAFQAGDTVTLNFSSAIEALLKNAGTTLSATTADVVLVGTAFGSTTNVRAVDGGNNTTLQFDLNGDGLYTAAADFSVEILGLANNTLNYIAATDVFTFTATA